MQEVLAVALTAMHQDMARVDRVAQNLVNVDTPAYRREAIAVRAFASALEGAQAPHAAPGGAEAITDVRQGAIKSTGQPLDLAILGEGFLEVRTDAGPAYTRQGSLRLDARGRLITAAGHPVMGKDGEIVLATQTPAIDAAGRITDPDAVPGAAGAGEPLAQLRVVRFEDPRHLTRLGGGLFAPPTGVAGAMDDHPQLRQGALEASNVSSTQEMVQLIQTMRHFESMQKVVQGYDELLGTAIRKLGDLS